MTRSWRPRPARVLVASSVHPSEDPRIRFRTVGALAEGGMAVVLATRGPAPTGPDNCRWVELPGGRLRRLLAVGHLAWRAKPDVVSLHDPELLLVGVLLALRGTAVVFDLHEDLLARAAVRGPWLSAVTRWLLRGVQRLLTVTVAEESYTEVFSRRPTVLRNHPSYSTFPDPPTAADVVARRGLIYLGDVTRRRGAVEMVEAAAAVDLPLRLIGRVDQDLADELRERAARLGIELRLEGWLPHPAALQAVATSEVGLCPLHDIGNYRHSLPTKVLEYLALGVPVVASDLPGTREIVADLAGGVALTPPGDPEALAAGITVARQPEQVQAAVAGAAGIRARYRWPADEVVELYARLAAR